MTMDDGGGAVFCPVCQTLIHDPQVDRCSTCGASLVTGETARTETVEQVPAAERAATLAPPSTRARVVLVLVMIFAVVGLGLGLATVLFLWANGYFKPLSAQTVGQSYLGSIAVGAVLVSAVLIGVLIAAVGGIYAAQRAAQRRAAATSGALAGAIGHVALVFVLGAVLLIGFELFVDRPSPSPPAATPSEGVPQGETGTADCEAIFGQNSPACGAGTLRETSRSQDPSDEVTFGGLSKLLLGAIPAALVGGLTAATVFPRRRRDAKD
jgi:hypothetical protein